MFGIGYSLLETIPSCYMQIFKFELQKTKFKTNPKSQI